MTNIITSLSTKPTQSPTKAPAVPFSFGTKEFNDLKNKFLSVSPLNPATDQKKFEAAAKARGYDFFSSQSLQNWKDVYGQLDYADILQMALLDTSTFMNSVKDPSNVDHDRNRLLFSNFDSNEEKLRQYFLNKESEEHGFSDRPFRDLSHENRILNMNRPLSTKHAMFEYQTFKNLTLAKWAAIGYTQDEAYKQKFLNDYCIALK